MWSSVVCGVQIHSYWYCCTACVLPRPLQRIHVSDWLRVTQHQGGSPSVPQCLGSRRSRVHGSRPCAVARELANSKMASDDHPRPVHETAQGRNRYLPLVRIATDKDVPALFSIHTSSIRECCSAYYTSDEIATWVERQSPHKYLPFVQRQCIYVAEERGDVVGFAHLDQGPDERSGEVMGLYVSPSATQRGIGGRILCFLERQAVCSKGWTSLVVKSTLNAVGFYTSRGFAVSMTMCCTQLAITHCAVFC